MRTVRFIGPGRAGRSFAVALASIGWHVDGLRGRGDDPVDAARGVDLLVLSTPDDRIAEVAAAVEPWPGTVVMHLSGSLGLDVLAPHPRRAALHPLVPLPDEVVGSARLTGGATFAVSGDPIAREVASALGGRVVTVTDDQRTRYHAAASIAANHVVALLGQVERVATSAGLDLQTFLGLTRAALDDVERVGPRRALTGPAARGDWATLARHRDALAEEDRPGYNAGVNLAIRLATPVTGESPAPATVDALAGAAGPATVAGPFRGRVSEQSRAGRLGRASRSATRQKGHTGLPEGGARVDPPAADAEAALASNGRV